MNIRNPRPKLAALTQERKNLELMRIKEAEKKLQYSPKFDIADKIKFLNRKIYVANDIILTMVIDRRFINHKEDNVHILRDSDFIMKFDGCTKKPIELRNVVQLKNRNKSAYIKRNTSSDIRNVLFQRYPVLQNLNYNNLFIAGGCLTDIIIGDEDNIKDIDIFVYGLNKEEATEKIKLVLLDIFNFVLTNYNTVFEDWTNQMIALNQRHIDDTNRFTEAQNNLNAAVQNGQMQAIPALQLAVTQAQQQIVQTRSEQYQAYRNRPKRPNLQRGRYSISVDKFQIILRLYNTKSEILYSFDHGSCSVGFDGVDVYVTNLGKFSLETGYNIVDNCKNPVNYERRLLKYCYKGFHIIFPLFDYNKIPQDKTKLNFHRLKINNIRVVDELVEIEKKVKYTARIMYVSDFTHDNSVDDESHIILPKNIFITEYTQQLYDFCDDFIYLASRRLRFLRFLLGRTDNYILYGAPLILGQKSSNGINHIFSVFQNIYESEAVNFFDDILNRPFTVFLYNERFEDFTNNIHYFQFIQGNPDYFKKIIKYTLFSNISLRKIRYFFKELIDPYTKIMKLPISEHESKLKKFVKENKDLYVNKANETFKKCNKLEFMDNNRKFLKVHTDIKNSRHLASIWYGKYFNNKLKLLSALQSQDPSTLQEILDKNIQLFL